MAAGKADQQKADQEKVNCAHEEYMKRKYRRRQLETLQAGDGTAIEDALIFYHQDLTFFLLFVLVLNISLFVLFLNA